MENNNEMKIVSPWVNFYREVEELFRLDDEVTVKFDDEKCELKLYVEDERKAEAIAYLLPVMKQFGNVTMTITVFPMNTKINNAFDAFRIAFKDNRMFSGVQKTSTPFGDIKYAIFRPETAQYFNDDMFSLCGVKTTVYEDIAKDVLEAGDVHITSECYGHPVVERRSNRY